MKSVVVAAERVVYEFEGFRLDTHTQTLRSSADGAEVPLKPKEFDTLLYFVEHAGELISKETLMSALWPGLVVEENNLNQYVTALRKLLGEERGGRRFIMNVRARGYRFVPPVLRLQANAVVRSGGAAASQPTEDLIAWQCYQQAVHHLHADHTDLWVEAIGLLEKAVQRDPRFAAAYAYMAMTRVRLFLLDHPEGKDALDKGMAEAQLAVQWNPSLQHAHMALGAINAARGNWVQAELSFLSSRELDREWCMPALMHSAHILLSVGHLQRALQIGRDTLRDLKGVSSLAGLHATVCMLAEADDEATQAVELAKAMGAVLNHSPMSDVLAMQEQRQGHFDVAANCLVGALTPYLQQAGTADIIRRVFAAMAEPSQRSKVATALTKHLQGLDMDRIPQTMRRQFLLWYTELGALDAAFEFAFATMANYRKSNMVGTAWGSLWLREMTPFRRDERFNEFARELRLTEYWDTFGPPDNHRWQGQRLIVVEDSDFAKASHARAF